MEIVVDVKSANVLTKTVKRARDGKEFVIRYQDGFVSLGGEVRRIEVPVADDGIGYKIGRYVIDERSLQVGRFGRLEVGRLILRAAVPAATPGTRAA